MKTVLWWLIGSVILVPSVAPAQEQGPDTRPAFSIATSQSFTTRERPSISLTFRRVNHLDFRVYRVKDPLGFFAQLKDLHQLGSEAPVVPQERTLIERIADWKAARRQALRSFLRSQFSLAYRKARRERADAEQVQLRRTVRAASFAQVPLLNPSQIVSSWRELLPERGDTEARRIPLDLPEPGLYLVEAVHAPLKAYTIVLVGDAGLITKTAPGQLLVFASDRFSGRPLSNCAVQVLADQRTVADRTTNEEGLAVVDLGDTSPDALVAVARCGTAVAASDPLAWYLTRKPRELVGYVYTDKPIYRPGHTVRIKAVLRWRAGEALLPFDRPDVEVAVSDSNDKVVYRQRARVDEFGAASASVTLGPSAALGPYAIQIATGDEQAGAVFEVQEYRRPEFEVVVTPEARFVRQGDSARATVRARYYFGQAVAAATVRYVVHRQEYFSPLRWRDDEDEEGGWWYGAEQVRDGTARLGEDGSAVISVPLDVHPDGRDYSFRIEARVTDASGREVSGHTIVHGTFGRFLLTTRVDGYVFRPQTPTTLRIRAIDYEGVPQADVLVNVWLERMVRPDWQSEPEITRVAESLVRTDADGRAEWPVTLPDEPGDYRFRASAASGDRTVRDERYVWVTGPRERTVEDQFLELVADRGSYQPGETARVLVRGADFETTVLVTKEGRRVAYHRVAHLRANQALEVPIEPTDVGDTYLNVTFFREDRLFRAERRLRVPAASRQLTIAVEADRAVARPGEPASFTLLVTDASGQPVQAQLSIGVIDEAVYGVKADQTPDPARFFYRLEYSRVGTTTSREYSFVGYSGSQQLLLTRRRRPITLADFKTDQPARPQVRKDFPDAIYWVADLTTDQNGRARVTLTYPDALTTWRLTARAVTTSTLVGHAVVRTTTTKDLILRLAPPRFLTEGDELQLPVIVHNYLPGARSVRVDVVGDGLAAAGQSSATVTVARNGEARQDWRFTANRVGSASVTGRATTDDAHDAVELPIPVQPAGLARSTSRAGSLTGAAEQTVTLEIPPASNPATRTLAVALAPSLAGSLLGALDYLVTYPYGCTEQILSSFVPALAVTRALAELGMDPPERLRGLDRRVSEGLRRLYDYQHDDGGWGWWRTDENHPFMTAYALAGLLQAQEAGYKVETWRLGRAATSLAAQYGAYPRAVPDLKAYMAYVLALAATRRVVPETSGGGAFSLDTAVAGLWESHDRLSPYGRGLLLLALQTLGRAAQAEELDRQLLAAVQTKGDLAWWDSPRDPLLLDLADTSAEATAVIVKALAARHPSEPILESAVRWLLLNRNYGTYWSSTKQTAVVLMGLLDYMKARREKPEAFSVDVIVNGAAVATKSFTPAGFTSPDPVIVSHPAAAESNTVRLVKRGGGTLYWSASGRYHSTEPSRRTGTHELALVRRYFRLAPVEQRGRIVYRAESFAGQARPGDLLLVHLTAAGATDWRYLMIEDPIPAGTEGIQNDELYELEQRAPFAYGSRREMRDNRVVFFQESFEAGRYEYRYLLKVTTPGAFTAPPAQISAMYVPDSSAWTEALTLAVK